MGSYQEGIFYKYMSRRRFRNSTFAVLLLRAFPNRSATDVKIVLGNLWKMYDLLSYGKLSSSKANFPNGNLSTLIGYAPAIFSLKGIRKSIPQHFSQFLPPTKKGDLLEGCGVRYSHDNPVNLGLTEGIIIQFIANRQLPVYRAIAETWKSIRATKKSQVLQISKIYTGFERDDGRSWLGFHDEVSNLKNLRERKQAVLIDPTYNDMLLRDYWTIGGTYMAYLRIEIDLAAWEKFNTRQQELIVGRNKETGSPLLGVDRSGNPVTATDRTKKNEPLSKDPRFVDHPDYFMLQDAPRQIRNKLDISASTKTMSQSHIGRVRHIDAIKIGLPSSRRIYRQGFEFIEPSNSNSIRPFKVGLNFVSYQNDPSRLFFILSDPNWMGGSNFGGASNKNAFSTILSVLSSGIFYVPPHEMPFPGCSIFG